MLFIVFGGTVYGACRYKCERRSPVAGVAVRAGVGTGVAGAGVTGDDGGVEIPFEQNERQTATKRDDMKNIQGPAY